MRTSLLLFLVALCNLFGFAQPDLQKIEIAIDAPFLKQSEREMISEINYVRAYPREYLKFVLPYLQKARENYKLYGKTPTSFSIKKRYKKNEAGNTIVFTDTIWVNKYEDEIKALSTLVRKLKTMHPVITLEAHEGIYNAASKHGKELEGKKWVLTHRGKDGSWPADRIVSFASEMKTGNENLASKEVDASTREIVISLLIDAGVKGHVHRKNILNPTWTHIACYYGGLYNNQHQWVQKFGKDSNDNIITTGMP